MLAKGNQVMSAKEALERKIREVCTVHGNFRLRSGALTDIYFDKYLFESDPLLLQQICLELGKQWTFPSQKFDYIAGLETGGVPIATLLSQQLRIPTLFVRKEPKKYGTCKFAEGAHDLRGQRLLVIEDVVTTGGQVMKSCADLKEEGALVEAVACVILRDKKGKENIESAYNFSSLFDFISILFSFFLFSYLLFFPFLFSFLPFFFLSLIY